MRPWLVQRYRCVPVRKIVAELQTMGVYVTYVDTCERCFPIVQAADLLYEQREDA